MESQSRAAQPCINSNESKKSWRHGSSGKVPAQQAQGPQLNPWYDQKKNFKFVNFTKGGTLFPFAAISPEPGT
jgi:hypothetical protein